MMKGLKTWIYVSSLAVLAFGLTACEKTNVTNEESSLLKEAVVDFVNKTVVPTYKSLADETIELVATCEAMEEAYGTDKLASLQKTACEQWISARKYWELSEAFLYGAAQKYGIDPHIDSWPLDYAQLAATLADPVVMSNMGDDYVVSNLGSGLLGFHGLEYMLFEDGSNRPIEKYTDKELVYTAAVARDLRNSCIVLEAAWAGSVTSEKQQCLDDAEKEVTDNFGEYMCTAGQAGSIYKSYKAAAQEIIQGCIDIADEVANTKIANAYSGGDPDYIESPHAKNSQTDFADNIRSIRNSYCGSNSGDANLSDYVKTFNATLDTKLCNAIENAIKAIEAANGPFVDNIQDASWGEAIDVVNELRDVLQEVMEAL